MTEHRGQMTENKKGKRAPGKHNPSPVVGYPSSVPCGRCPAFDSYLEWDWTTPVYLKQTRKGANGAEEDVLDGDGKPILRKGPDGQPIRVGACVLRSTPAQADGAGFPRRLSTMRCEDPDKHALIARLKRL